jgi:hypothetical protein
MITFPFAFLFLLSSWAAPSDENNSGWEIKEPTKETWKVYKKAKFEILHFHRTIFRMEDNISEYASERKARINESVPEYAMLFKSLKILDREELLKALIVEDSLEFIIILFYSFPFFGKNLVFENINSLLVFKPPELKDVLNNFRIFLSHTIRKSKPLNWTDSSHSSVGYQLMDLFRVLWNSKIKPLGRKILTFFSAWEESIENRFKLLDLFLAHKTEDLLIIEYGRLRKKQSGMNILSHPEIQNFCFLAQHFKKALKEVNSSEYLSRFQWFSSQSSLFHSYFDIAINFPFFDDYPLSAHLYCFSWKHFSFHSMVFVKSDKTVAIFWQSISATHGDYWELRKLVNWMMYKFKLYSKKMNSTEGKVT